ncbi:MAG: nucleotidyltransferase domain-containing protein [Edaphocola sp.]
MLTIEQIQSTVADYFKDKPVKRVYLFGSYARGEADENSDVDLLVDLDKTKKIGWKFFGWLAELNVLFGNGVDVVSNVEKPEHTNNWQFMERVNREKFLLYEK